MQSSRLNQAQSEIGELWDQIHALRDELRNYLSNGGGAVDGQVDFGDRVQMAVIGRPDAPRENIVSIYPLDNGHLYAQDWLGVEYDLTGLSGLEGVFAPVSVSWLVLEHNDLLTQERRFVVGDGLDYTDGGANGDYTLVVALAAAWSGLEFDSEDLRIDLDAAFAWTNDHSWDAGTGDSPTLTWITGSDDQFSIWAENDATPGHSDLVVKLPGADADSGLIVRDSGDTDASRLDAAGNIHLLKGTMHNIYGAGDTSRLLLYSGSALAHSAYVAVYSTSYENATKGGGVGFIANTAGSAGHISFYRYDGASTWTQSMVIEGSEGNVGVGPTWPTGAALLHVNQANSIGAKAAMLLNQGDMSEQHIMCSMDGADQDFPAILQLDVTGAPTLWWDESENSWILTDELLLSEGDLHLASGLGIVHANSVAAGMVLGGDGARFIPVQASANYPVAPGDQGHILRGEAGPVWTSYDASPAGAVLIGDGTDITSTTAPTLTDNWTWDDGVGNSPSLILVSESGDQAVLYLLDAASGDSDLVVQLCADDADSGFLIRNLSGTTTAYIDATGNSAFSEYIYHYADADTYLWFQDDQIALAAGGVTFLSLVEGANDYISVGATILLNDHLLILDADDDTYLYASGDDVIDLILAGAAGEFGIHVNGSEDFMFTANSFNVLSGSAVTMADDTWIGLSSSAGRIKFDNLTEDLIELLDAKVFVGNTCAEYDSNLDVNGVIGAYKDYSAAVPGAALNVFTFGDNALAYSRVLGRRARGSEASLSAVQADDVLFRIGGGGYSGAGGWPSQSSGLIQWEATQTHTGAAKGTRERHYITANGSTSLALAMEIHQSGIVYFPNGLRTDVSTANVTDTGPTDAQLDATFGTPVSVGSGWIGIVDDAGAHARVWLVASDGTNWWVSYPLSLAP